MASAAGSGRLDDDNCCPSARSEGAALTTIRVASFNVRHCEVPGPPAAADVDTAAAAVASLQADLVALQEVDSGLERSGRIDQARAIAEGLGLRWQFSAAISRDDAAYGIALLARDTIEGETHRLPGDHEPRVCFAGRVGAVSVAATHLSVRPEESAPQLEVVVGLALGLPRPRIVVGDLNRGPEALDVAAAGGFRPAGGVLTWPRKRPRRQIDHVLCQDDMVVTGVAAPLLAVSDHRPLVVDLVARGHAPFA